MLYLSLLRKSHKTIYSGVLYALVSSLSTAYGLGLTGDTHVEPTAYKNHYDTNVNTIRGIQLESSQLEMGSHFEESKISNSRAICHTGYGDDPSNPAMEVIQKPTYRLDDSSGGFTVDWDSDSRPGDDKNAQAEIDRLYNNPEPGEYIIKDSYAWAYVAGHCGASFFKGIKHCADVTMGDKYEAGKVDIKVSHCGDNYSGEWVL